MAAYLWGGEEACVSHRSAARLHGFEEVRGDRVEISTPKHLNRRPGVKLYEVGESLTSQTRSLSNMRTTNVTRTLIDLCAVEPIERVELVLDDALRRGWASINYLERQLARLAGKGMAGTQALRELIVERRDIAIQESTLNTRCWRILRRSKVMQPIPEYRVFGRRSGTFLKRIDFGYPSVLVGVEGNSRRWHMGGSNTLFDYETDKHNLLTEDGWLILYFRWRDLADDGKAFLSRLDDVLLERLGHQRL